MLTNCARGKRLGYLSILKESFKLLTQGLVRQRNKRATYRGGKNTRPTGFEPGYRRKTPGKRNLTAVAEGGMGCCRPPVAYAACRRIERNIDITVAKTRHLHLGFLAVALADQVEVAAVVQAGGVSLKAVELEATILHGVADFVQASVAVAEDGEILGGVVGVAGVTGARRADLEVVGGDILS